MACFIFLSAIFLSKMILLSHSLQYRADSIEHSIGIVGSSQGLRKD